MGVNLVQIADSREICLSSKIIDQCQIDQCQIKNKLNLAASNDMTISETKRKAPRLSWAEAAKKMHKNHDDILLIPDVFNDEEFPEW